MSFRVPEELETEINGLIQRYPQKRSASLMILHALQAHFGWISQDAAEWTASKLDLRPINVYELITFYPMFRQEPAGTFQLKVCRTLSCSLAGADALFQHFCKQLGLDPGKHGLQTTPDGRFSLEFVECLAGCDRAPVMMCGDRYLENVTTEQADQLMEECRKTETKKPVTAVKRKKAATRKSTAKRK